MMKLFNSKEPHLLEIVDEASDSLRQIIDNTTEIATKDWCHHILQIVAIQVKIQSKTCFLLFRSNKCNLTFKPLKKFIRYFRMTSLTTILLMKRMMCN